MPAEDNGRQTAAQLLIRSLVQQNVKHIFGIPGGKIMPTFDVLRDEGPRLIVCRHEQNAAFMAAAVVRLSGRPGVCLVTSGPGTGNLVTGAATATTEGDPMVAIGGVVALPDTLKQTHQTMDSVAGVSSRDGSSSPEHRLLRSRRVCSVRRPKPARRRHCSFRRWAQLPRI